MSIMELLALSIALGTDLFSVAVPIGLVRLSAKVIARAAVVFALFHVAMILIGFFIGRFLGRFVEDVGAYHMDWPVLWVQSGAQMGGALILMGLGVRIIWEACRGFSGGKPVRTNLDWPTLLLLAVGVSIDALAAGLGLGMMDVDLVQMSLVLGGVIFLIAVVGLGLGQRFGQWAGVRSGLIGGAGLILLGLHVFWTAL